MRTPDRGFTLVEVLVATLIIVLVGAATAETFRGTTNLLSENERYSEASALAQAVVEDLRTVPYAEIASGVRKSEDGRFVLTTAVAENSPDPGMKEIVVTAVWQWKGEPRTYALRTVYSRLTQD